jgi:hypothetical protein
MKGGKRGGGGWGGISARGLVEAGRLPASALEPSLHGPARSAAGGELPPPLRRGRQPNKTEARWLAQLAVDATVKRAVFEGVTLRLAEGVRYTPDVFVEYFDGGLGLDEVKGAFIRPDALVKLRIAVSQFPCFRWRLAQYRRGAWAVRTP